MFVYRMNDCILMGFIYLGGGEWCFLVGFFFVNIYGLIFVDGCIYIQRDFEYYIMLKEYIKLYLVK